MPSFRPLSTMSLRTKLVLSFMVVTIGAILVLAFAVSIVVSNYFHENQLNDLRIQAAMQIDQIGSAFRYDGTLANNNRIVTVLSNTTMLTVLTDKQGKQMYCKQSNPILIDPNGHPVINNKPGHISPTTQDICNNPDIQNAMIRAVHENQEIDGDINIAMPDGSYNSVYIAVPLEANGQPIGALFLASGDRRGAYFIKQVNEAIILSGVIVSLLIMFFSYMFARRFTQPVEALTLAAEQMKLGRYTSRVTTPKAQDELGRLAQTFNEMADTIEADVNELRHQEEFRRELVANISHDLATPLTAIQGFSEALSDNLISDPNERQETAQRIAREVQRLRRLVADLRQVSSLERGQTGLDLAPLDIHTLVAETLAVIEPECEHAGIQLHNEVGPDTPQVLADSDRITQVLLNLLDNARRHTHSGGKISIGSQRKQRDLHIWVSDTGSGISSKDLPRIFERFYRADRSRTTSTGGSGLGLSIVKAIITTHHGKIWAESKLGKGTRITFTLPLTNGQQ